MFCYRCGGQISDGASVCPLCGAAQTASRDPAANAGAGYAQQPVYTAPPFAEPPKAKSAQSMSIAGLCMQYFNIFPLVGLILCIVGIVSANQSRAFSGGGYSPSAKVARTCGVIGVVLAAVKAVTAIAVFVLVMVFFGGLAGLLANLPEIIEGFEEEFLLIAAMI